MLIINPKFQKLIPTLSQEEFNQLEKNIIDDGCRDPLVVWNNAIIDGHNRYAICQKHAIEFKTHELLFDGESSAMAWMEDNQLGRRNLTPDQFRWFLGRKYNREKQQGVRTDLTLAQNGTKINTAQKIAEENGTSKNTVKRAGTAVAKIEAATPEIQEAVRDGVISLPAASTIASEPTERQNRVLDKIIDRKASNPQQAIRQLDQEGRVASTVPIDDPEIMLINGECVALTKNISFDIDLVITDPPYGIDTHNTRRGEADYSDGQDYALELLDSLCKELVEKCSKDAHLYFFSGYSHYPKFKEILSRWFDVQDNPLIWVKENHTMCDFSTSYPNRHEYIIFCRIHGSKRKLANCVPDVLNFKRERSSTHSAEKPTELLKLLIDQSSLPGEMVFDPFMGSGSAGVAARELNRGFTGVEMDKDWYDVAESRIVRL